MTLPDRMSASDYRFLKAAPKRPKYGNVPTEIDGHRFDSKAEARFYADLRLREKAGEVADVRLQEPFNLRGTNGHIICVYRADFVFYDYVLGRQRVIDIKGGKATQTEVFRLKKKLMQDNHGIEVEIVGGAG